MSKTDLRNKALNNLEKLKATGVKTIPFEHPLMMDVFKYLLSTEKEESTRPLCPNCQYALGQNWRFCSNCGHWLGGKSKVRTTEGDFVVVVLRRGGEFDCILDDEIMSSYAVKARIRQARIDDNESGYPYQYRSIQLKRANAGVEPTVSTVGKNQEG